MASFVLEMSRPLASIKDPHVACWPCSGDLPSIRDNTKKQGLSRINGSDRRERHPRRSLHQRVTRSVVPRGQPVNGTHGRAIESSTLFKADCVPRPSPRPPRPSRLHFTSLLRERRSAQRVRGIDLPLEGAPCSAASVCGANDHCSRYTAAMERFSSPAAARC